MGDAARSEVKQTPLPDVGDIIFIFIILIPLMVLPCLLFADGSTGWHLVTGNYVLDHHAVPKVDLFSYTFPGKQWVAYEWLSDAIMAALVRLGGTNLLAVTVSGALGLLFLLLYDRCRKEGCHFFIVLFISLVGILVSALHWLARPHLFTFFGVFIFSSLLEDYYRRTISSTKLISCLALYMVLWVNCHPAFLVGYALIVIYLASAVASGLYYGPGELRTQRLQAAKTYAIALVATFAATLLNPYGLQLYEYIAQYLKGSSVLAATDEFLSPIFHGGLHPTCLEILFVAFVVGLAISLKRLSLPRLLCCLAFSHLALSAVRNMPLLVFILLPAIAQLWSKTYLTHFLPLPASLSTVGSPPVISDSETTSASASPASSELPSESSPVEVSTVPTFADGSGSSIAAGGSVSLLPEASAVDLAQANAALVSPPPAKWWLTLLAWWNKFGEMIDDQEWRCKMHLLPIGAFVLLVGAALMGGKPFGVDILDSGFDPKKKPTVTLEYLKAQENAHRLEVTKGFNYDNWGGYINYKIGTPVFIDDRADFYGERHYLEYSTLSLALPGWQDVLKKRDFQWVIFPKDSRFAQALMTEAHWKVAKEDPASYLLVRPEIQLP